MISPVLRTAALTLGAAALLAVIVWGTSSLLLHRQPSGAPSTVRAPPVFSVRDLVATAGVALEACPVPSAPPVPDSARASLDEMKAARTAFQAYDTATNAYTQCVDSTIARTAKQYAGVASESDIEALNAFGARAHNAAIDQEKTVVDQFNTQIRAYKDKHPE